MVIENEMFCLSYT